MVLFHDLNDVPQIFEAMLAGVLPMLTGGSPLLSQTLRVERPEGEKGGGWWDWKVEKQQLEVLKYLGKFAEASERRGAKTRTVRRHAMPGDGFDA